MSEVRDACPVNFEGKKASAIDLAVCKVLRVSTTDNSAKGEDSAQRLFSVAMVISGVRCILSYVIFPFLLPALGLGGTAGVGPAIGIPVGVVALAFDVRGVRRFWIAGHRWRWQMTFIYLGVMGLVSYLVIGDIVQLIG